MIRIGVDCRPLKKHRAGIGRYLYEILNELAFLDNDVEFYLYAPWKIHIPESCQNDSRFIVRTMNFRPGVLWLHTILPLMLSRDKINVFWGPGYAVPMVKLHAYKSVSTIHDVTYARVPKTMKWSTYLHNRVMVPVYAVVSDCILTDSEFSKREICQVLPVDPGKVTVISLAADSLLKRQQVANQTPRSDEYILYVGTIEPRKNIERIVAAYASLPYHLRQAHKLVLVGGKGWGHIDPVALCEQYGADTTMYLGNVSDEEMSLLYNKTAVFVFPSLYEGFGLPALEASAFGVPVLCSYGSALEEVTAGSALYCDAYSVDDIASKLQILLEDPALRKSLSRRGRMQASRFSWANTARQTLMSLLAKGGR